MSKKLKLTKEEPLEKKMAMVEKSNPKFVEWLRSKKPKRK